ncbi:hypothetical protein [Nocardia terpenica]|uniref:hypothetical protein n=1 Tax=Nocardia terpenica TaxID=455432 RepID=UPI00031B99B0|nr:hypothetical protein [Nocardia terpenica]NQE90909.1 hypothetical protein [Nocardia terpenica]
MALAIAEIPNEECFERIVNPLTGSEGFSRILPDGAYRDVLPLAPLTPTVALVATP